jgi:hypothetical protein
MVHPLHPRTPLQRRLFKGGPPGDASVAPEERME